MNDDVIDLHKDAGGQLLLSSDSESIILHLPSAIVLDPESARRLAMKLNVMATIIEQHQLGRINIKNDSPHVNLMLSESLSFESTHNGSWQLEGDLLRERHQLDLINTDWDNQ